MEILMTGSTGLIGKSLTAALTAGGRQVIPIRRRPGAGPGVVEWIGLDDGADAVIHLAGESLSNGRWTKAKKHRIEASRVQGTGLLARTIAGLKKRPRVLLCASAI